MASPAKDIGGINQALWEALHRGKVIKARDKDELHQTQIPMAVQADIIMRGLATVGIIALIDEATGYQSDRASNALAKILEAFIAKELQPYVPTFPQEFYEEIFRLRKLEFPKESVKRPQYFGVLTNDIIYKRLAPGACHLSVLQEGC